MPPSPIRRMVVDALVPESLGDGFLIRWDVDPYYCNREFIFEVLVGSNPSAGFSKIGETRVPYFLDSDGPSRRHNRLDEVYYAIRSIDSKNSINFSAPQRVGSNWTKQDWILARQIAREENVRLRKTIAGVRGWLLKRKSFGDPCPDCLEPSTGEVTNPNCESCFGTGIDGGYYPPIEMWVELTPEKIIRKLESGLGTIFSKIRQIRALSYPPFSSNDFWVHSSTNHRFRIQSPIAAIAEVASVPVVMQADVQDEEFNDVIYKFPVNDIPRVTK